MKRGVWCRVILGFCVFFCNMGVVLASGVVWEEIGGGNFDLTALLVNPDNPRQVYLGAKSVIITEDAGVSWRHVLFVKGSGGMVNALSFDPANKSSLYAATGNGLFYSRDRGRNWKRIYKGANYLEKECQALAVLAGNIYLGTKAGLFISKDNGRGWIKATGKMSNSSILAITTGIFRDPSALRPQDDPLTQVEKNSREVIYVTCLDGLFKSQDAGESWERIFSFASPAKEEVTQEENNDLDEEAGRQRINFVIADPDNFKIVYLATSAGIYKSSDGGASWEVFSDYGLLQTDARLLIFSPQKNLYAVCASGIFEYRDDRWNELSLELPGGQVRSLGFDGQDNLYAACQKGLFKGKTETGPERRATGVVASYLKQEPLIEAVQKAAIKYAEVEPEKIIQWRRQAGIKAWLPKVNAGLNRDVADLWHWEGGSTTKADDDVLKRGRDSVEWDLSLSWDLGELIWTDAQTSIDARSRLMVELRDDILDEVTKLYFERVRVKMEIDSLGIEERRKRFEKELKLQELAASLDALTGGYFSRHITQD